MDGKRVSSTETLDRALARLAPAADFWVAALARMLAADTSFPPGAGYAAFADLMEETFSPLGFAGRRVEVPEALWRVPGGMAHGPRVNLIAARAAAGSGRPTCSIYFHVDCVPPGAGWTRPPLTLTRDGDRLYGRGASDMKGAIAAVFAALTAARDAGVKFAFEPVLLFCTDEEGGAYPGVRYLADRGLIQGHVLCLNGGAAPRIWAGCFGSLDFSVRVVGRAAHSGDPGNGVNAAEAAVPVLNALLALKPRIEARVSALPPPPRHGGAPLRARLNVTAVNAGSKGSALPGECAIVVNRRYTPEEDFAAVRSEVEAAIAEGARASPALAVETQVVGHLAPVVDPDGGPYWPRWIDALSRGFEWPRESFRRYGASSGSDMGFVQASGRRDILLGGLSRPENNGHAADEFTTIGDVNALARAVLIHLAG